MIKKIMKITSQRKKNPMSILQFPVAVNATGTSPRWIMCVVNNSINYCCKMMRKRHHKASFWQLLSTKMNTTTATDEHGWCPFETKVDHVTSE
jgi:hypothetical protein